MSTPTKREAAAAAEKEGRKDLARKAAYNAPAESARMIVELGQERLKALQTGGVALDNRTTQVAAIQLAAAAFAAGLTVTDKITVIGATFAATACIFFVLGSGLAFWGMRSCDNQVAGVNPTFWRDILTTRRFSDKVAWSWAAEVTEAGIIDACAVDRARGGWLDRSLVAGGLGASFIMLAVGTNLVERWTNAPAAAGGYMAAVLAGPPTLPAGTPAVRPATPNAGPVLPAVRLPQPFSGASTHPDAPMPVKAQ